MTCPYEAALDALASAYQCLGALSQQEIRALTQPQRERIVTLLFMCHEMAQEHDSISNHFSIAQSTT